MLRVRCVLVGELIEHFGRIGWILLVLVCESQFWCELGDERGPRWLCEGREDGDGRWGRLESNRSC